MYSRQRAFILQLDNTVKHDPAHADTKTGLRSYHGKREKREFSHQAGEK